MSKPVRIPSLEQRLKENVKFRAIATADALSPGYVVLIADESWLELRLAAVVAS